MIFDPAWRQRKSPRLKDYDYSQNGAYFITICTQNHLCMFGEILESVMQLNEAGHMIANSWQKLDTRFPHILLDAYVVMPNHMHAILTIMDGDTEIPLTQIIQWFKSITTHDYSLGVREHGWESFPGKLWQRSFYDKIIRHDRMLDAIRTYIAANPSRWADDHDNPINFESTSITNVNPVFPEDLS